MCVYDSVRSLLVSGVTKVNYGVRILFQILNSEKLSRIIEYDLYVQAARA